MRKIMIAAIAAMSMSLVACGDATGMSVKQEQSQKAAQAAANIKFTGNGEIDNIKKRLELTSKPGIVGFILLLNEMGQPIMYTSVVGKITSSGKRLTQPFQNCPYVDCGAIDAPSDEGTWGSSDPYIYFWTTNGQYIQWNGKYMYSDKPFRTTSTPLVVDVK